MLTEMQLHKLRRASYEMRRDILDLCFQCGTQKGHLGGCMSTVELLAVLYLSVMNISGERMQGKTWEDRDRFVLSKGHAGMALYAALYQAGILSKEQMQAGIRGENTILFRHPKYNPRFGIECSVGSLGMGIGFSVGLAEALKREGKDSRVFCMLGDGECNEGAVWESLAYASHRHLDHLIIIIDVNGLQLDGPTQDVLNMGDLEEKVVAFGFESCTIDGHDFKQIYEAFQIEHQGKPLAILAKTVKGKGISFAENKTEWHDNILTDELYHCALEELDRNYIDVLDNHIKAVSGSWDNFGGVSPCRRNEKERIQLPSKILDELDYKNMVGIIADVIAEQDPYFCLVYSDCANRIGIDLLKEKHPDMCYETGIAEQNQVMVSAALAQEGFDVFAVAYAPFITARVLDQIRANLGYMQCPVKLIGLSAGFAASDLGATHTALEDIANLRNIPNMTVICPADCMEAAKAMAAVARWRTPVYIRITNTLNGNSGVVPKDSKFEVGKATILREGTDVAIIGCGAVLKEVMTACEKLKEFGISCKILNMHTVKPLDEQAIHDLIDMRLIVTVEEHSILGGLGGAVAEYLASYKKHAPLLRLGVPDRYYKADLPQNEMEKAGLLDKEIVFKIMEHM